MKNKILFYFILTLILSCGKESSEPIESASAKTEILKTLPFTKIELNDLSAFKPTSTNWQIAGNVVADRTKKQNFSTNQGTGVLLNITQKEAKEHLFTNFDHGDIELEFDVMMPVQSNSGIYFQGRYEIQLFDSWGLKNPKHSDMGGIYHRWNVNEKEGYEGHAPKLNAAKAPGLWQHFKILFRAPKFDNKGHKVKNAMFEEVFLNGRLLHQKIEVNGPTRSSAFNDEKPMGSLMIQGDHGAVALKNIKYKLYEDKNIEVKNSTLKIYKNHSITSVIKATDTFPKISEIKTDTIAPMMYAKRNERNISKFSGTLNIPTTGDYLFEMKVSGGAFFIINKDTIINHKAVKKDISIFKKIRLKKGDASYEILYNRPSPWNRNFDLFIEGPKIQRYSIKKERKNTRKKKTIKQITLNTNDTPITQRSFVIHKNIKRTHCISVGLPEKLNYNLDLATGSLLYVWSGDFLNTTDMWHSRGKEQIGAPIGFTIASHGDLDFAFLQNKNDTWPKESNKNSNLKLLGYEFNDKQIPEFSFKLNDAKISYLLTTSVKSKRGLNRIINIDSQSSLWHKIADGRHIKSLDNNTFIINDESYYINFSGNADLKPIIRSINGKNELMVEIPKGKTTINYSIVW